MSTDEEEKKDYMFWVFAILVAFTMIIAGIFVTANMEKVLGIDM